MTTPDDYFSSIVDTLDIGELLDHQYCGTAWLISLQSSIQKEIKMSFASDFSRLIFHMFRLLTFELAAEMWLLNLVQFTVSLHN